MNNYHYGMSAAEFYGVVTSGCVLAVGTSLYKYVADTGWYRVDIAHQSREGKPLTFNPGNSTGLLTYHAVAVHPGTKWQQWHIATGWGIQQVGRDLAYLHCVSPAEARRGSYEPVVVLRLLGADLWTVDRARFKETSALAREEPPTEGIYRAPYLVARSDFDRDLALQDATEALLLLLRTPLWERVEITVRADDGLDPVILWWDEWSGREGAIPWSYFVDLARDTAEGLDARSGAVDVTALISATAQMIDVRKGLSPGNIRVRLSTLAPQNPVWDTAVPQSTHWIDLTLSTRPGALAPNELIIGHDTISLGLSPSPADYYSSTRSLRVLPIL